MAADQSVLTGELCFDAGDPIYAAHFPGRPVVPGSLIVQAFLTAAENSGLSCRPLVVRDFRFKAFAAPGCYTYRIEVLPNNVLHCSLARDGIEVAVGRLQC